MTNKALFSCLLMLFPLFSTSTILAQCDNLIITAIFDGPLDGAPRGIELYAKKNITNLSIFSVGSANNGGGSDGEEFTLPARSIDAGAFIYISKDAAKFQDFFGFALDIDLIPSTNAAVGFLNGDDAIELFCNGEVVDVFGEIDHEKSGLNWNYEDGWGYRLSGTGPDRTTFTSDNWHTNRNVLDGAATNSTATKPIPIGTYDTFPACNRLLITGIYDGPLPGGEPQGIELYVTKDITDLSLFGFGSITNGGGSNGIEVDFPAIAVKANTFLYITSDSASFHDFFGFAPTLETSSANINGDDAVELFCKQGTPTVIDVFGDINVDGTGTEWAYMDGWAYRKDATGADDSTFLLNNWNFGGLNALEGGTTNEQADTRFPIGTYQPANVNDCIEHKELPAGNLTNGIYNASNSLTAKSTIPTNAAITFQAGKTITLATGFHAQKGGQFLARITDCSTSLKGKNIPSNILERKSLANNKENTALEKPITFDFQVYPNPTTANLTVDLQLQEKTTIQLQLVAITGQLVKILQPKQVLEKGKQQLWFDLSELNAGIYWLQVENEKKALTKRIVIIK